MSPLADRIHEGETAVSTVCATFGISKSTFYRYMAGDGTGKSAAPVGAPS